MCVTNGAHGQVAGQIPPELCPQNCMLKLLLWTVAAVKGGPQLKQQPLSSPCTWPSSFLSQLWPCLGSDPAEKTKHSITSVPHFGNLLFNDFFP